MSGVVANACEPAAAPAASKRSERSQRSLFESKLLVVALGVFVGVAMSWPKAVAVWTTNRFLDTDDAMHLVQALDWLHGQAWFDLTERRLGPPPGTLMHWTRAVDLPIGLLIRLFSTLVDPAAAERLTRLVYPTLLQICLYVAILWVARKLMGFRGAAAAVILAATSVSVVTQFAPGRINHHNLQILLLMLMIGAVIDACDRRRARIGALAAAALAGVSFAISLEDLPFIATMIALFGAIWIARGAVFARALAWFGGGLCVAGAAALVTMIPPRLYGAKFCDAFSSAHLLACWCGGASFVALALASRKLSDWRSRLLACAGAGALVLLALAIYAPACLGDPYGAVDPLARSVWLSHVTEAQPLGSMLRAQTLKALPVAVPIFIGTALAGLAALTTRGEARLRWTVAFAFAAMGAFGGFWEVIVASYAGVIVVFGAGWAFERLVAAQAPAAWPPRAAALGLLAPAALLAVMTPQSWAALSLGKPPERSAYGDPQACFASPAFRPLNALAPGLVLAPIDAGPYILALTRLSVLDGPYHRDNRGNRLAIEAFLGDPATAATTVRAAGVRYVAICPAADELKLYARLAPNGLFARLRDGKAPDWLRRIDVRGTPYVVYETQ